MFQQLIIAGNLGKDPEMRYTQNGVPYCNFSVAVTEAWTNDQGQRQEDTTWYSVTVWRKQAENCAQYLHKGSKVLVTGKVKSRAYTGRDGALGSSLDVKADSVKFLSSKGQGDDQEYQAGQQPGSQGQATYEEDIPF